jgi:hypothetical protein
MKSKRKLWLKGVAQMQAAFRWWPSKVCGLGMRAGGQLILWVAIATSQTYTVFDAPGAVQTVAFGISQSVIVGVSPG